MSFFLILPLFFTSKTGIALSVLETVTGNEGHKTESFYELLMKRRAFADKKVTEALGGSCLCLTPLPYKYTLIFFPPSLCSCTHTHIYIYIRIGVLPNHH